MLALAIFWNAISWAAVFADLDQISRAGVIQRLFIYLFPAAGIGLAPRRRD